MSCIGCCGDVFRKFPRGLRLTMFLLGGYAVLMPLNLGHTPCAANQKNEECNSAKQILWYLCETNIMVFFALARFVDCSIH